MLKLKVMISSRLNQELAGPGTPALSDVCGAIKEDLEERVMFDAAGEAWNEPLFEVEVSDLIRTRPANRTIEQYCVEMVQQADIVLALYNGQAGRAFSKGADGVCFLEMRTAVEVASHKLVVVKLPLKASPNADRRAADDRFADWLEPQQIWATDSKATTVDEVVSDAQHAMRVALANVVQDATARPRRGAPFGPVLDWQRKSYVERASAMRAHTASSLTAAGAKSAKYLTGETFADLPVGDDKLCVWIHAVPAAMSEPKAREMVGQPHLRDHEIAKKLNCGPLHVVACSRGVTENQAVKQLGHPDATIVGGAFGVYVADDRQKTQMAFIANCRDPTSTRGAVIEFKRWMERSGELELIVERGRTRAQIATLLAK